MLQLLFLKVDHKFWKNKTSRAILVVFPRENRTTAEATEAFSYTERESTQHHTPQGHSQCSTTQQKKHTYMNVIQSFPEAPSRNSTPVRIKQTLLFDVTVLFHVFHIYNS